MAQLSDYEISKIQDSIQKIESLYSSLTNKISKSDFSDEYRKANSKIQSYVKEENDGLKAAEKTIKSGMTGSGFFSSGGLNGILNKKIQDSNKEISEILNNYSTEISKIVDSLPSLEIPEAINSLLNSNEYDGDKDFSSDDFGIEKNQEIKNIVFPAPVIANSQSLDRNEESNKQKQANTNDFQKSPSTQTKQVAEDIYDKNGNDLITKLDTTVLEINAVSDPYAKTIKCTNVKSIKANAFRGSANIDLIIISNSIEYININAFRGLSNNCVIAFEESKETILGKLKDDSYLDGKKVLFNYDPNSSLLDAVPLYNKQPVIAKKRIIIKSNTALDSDEVKEAFLSRNSKYNLTIDDLNQGILKCGNNTDKDSIVFESLLISRFRALKNDSYWDYASALGYALKYLETKEKYDECFPIIYGLLYLESSGYRMVNGKYNPFKDTPSRLVYDVRMEFGTLAKLLTIENKSDSELSSEYKNSIFVKELTEKIPDAYYSVDDSVKLMLMALKKPEESFYPSKSGLIRKS
jgi:hypothetical protein